MQYNLKVHQYNECKDKKIKNGIELWETKTDKIF